MRRITLLTILSLVLVFGFAASASAVTLPNFNGGSAYNGITNTNMMTWTGNHLLQGKSNVMGTVYDALYNGGLGTLNKSDYNSPVYSTTFEQSLLNKGATVDFSGYTNAGNRIHGGYTANTDACSACHSVHTAVSDDGMLLQWTDVTSACMACHDGTVTVTYDVNAGIVTGTKTTSGGKFGFSQNANPGHTAHAVGAVNINTAPGGNIGGTVADIYGTWGANQFDCASCHDVHGVGGNARILSADPNGAARAKQQVYAYAYTAPQLVDYQQQIVSVDVYAVKMTVTGNPLVFGDTHTGNRKNWINGKPNRITKAGYVYGYRAGSSTPITYVFNVDYTLDSINGQVVFKQDPINNPKATQTGVSVIFANYEPALVVKMTVANKLKATETTTYVSGINNFCVACHTDYINGGSANRTPENAQGWYSQSGRHSVSMSIDPNRAFALPAEAGKATCLACHYAHGTDDAQSDTAYKAAYLNLFGVPYLQTLSTLDTTRSAALKRLPNMGVCENCHQWGGQSAQTY